MKQGQVVIYFPGRSDEQVPVRNGEHGFPAIITQVLEQKSEGMPESDQITNRPPVVNLIVFAWNGVAPVLGVKMADADFNPGDELDAGVYRPVFDSESAAFNPNIDVEGFRESIDKTQQMIESYAADTTKQVDEIGKAMNENVEQVVTAFNDKMKELEQLKAVVDSLTDQNKQLQEQINSINGVKSGSGRGRNGK